ncbi:WhiB family transcriptional regulator [Nocardia sp. NPDC056611]|uniref:WhiB family transcriptional regulator n=1 Tax=Nocardia sp. NPDC056611 TaxID=3345877 RepID=UPI003672A41B
MNLKIEDKWADAVCRQERYETWMRHRRASMWDWHVEGETPEQKQERHRKVRNLCFSCPLRVECLARHDELVRAKGERVPGVWGGRIHADRDRDDSAAAA